MKPYTIEEFIKNGKGENFTPFSYYDFQTDRWLNSSSFYTSDSPISKEKVDNLDCIIFISEYRNKYAVEITELQRLGILKKEEEFVVPEIFWVRVTEENVEILKKWSGIPCLNENHIVGKYKELDNGKIKIGYNPKEITKSNNEYKYDFGNRLSFENFKKYILKEEPVRIKSLEEEYIVRCENYIESNEVCRFIKGRSLTCSYYKYVIHSNRKTCSLWDDIPTHLKRLPILAFSEWKQLKDKEMNKDKKIIGYKAPYDIFNGKIKAGHLYKPLASCNPTTYCAMSISGQIPLDCGKTNLPKEIVETWEAVYEQEEIKIPMANGAFELVIKDGKVWHKTDDITNFVESLVDWYNIAKNGLTFQTFTANVDEVIFSKTGCQNHKTSIKEWINVHNKLHGK